MGTKLELVDNPTGGNTGSHFNRLSGVTAVCYRQNPQQAPRGTQDWLMGKQLLGYAEVQAWLCDKHVMYCTTDVLTAASFVGVVVQDYCTISLSLSK